MTVRNQQELQGILRVGRVVRLALDAAKAEVRVGASTQYLDHVCAKVFRSYGARSAPRLVYGFPGSACISVNDEAVHGIPSASRIVQAGDLVKIDVAAELDGYFADAAVTVAVGKTSSRDVDLARCAKSALDAALQVARAERPINVIGRAIQTEVERWGFNVMPELGGHGVGRTIHEDPHVHNYHVPWDNRRLHAGLVLAVEPVISSGMGRSTTRADGWTVETADGARSAHFEHTIVVTQGAPIVVTA